VRPPFGVRVPLSVSVTATGVGAVGVLVELLSPHPAASGASSRSARNVRNRNIETILLGVRRSSKIVGRDVAKKGPSRMRLLAITLASSITLVASHTYAQAPAGQAPATQKPPAPAPAA